MLGAIALRAVSTYAFSCLIFKSRLLQLKRTNQRVKKALAMQAVPHPVRQVAAGAKKMVTFAESLLNLTRRWFALQINMLRFCFVL